ncbi:DDE superfamily endonuclease [Myxococcus fulvus]|uniref:DDE superfamily endonuclease n=1 Tax=Myxococcus fulvus TaxID=33 RepID=A0A511TCB8_MYXFU|nr:hypothetical protein MFU01_68560 [Myxococcus fulvus]SEU40606.1 DDE superfamily endonuclease [Myxococcus fulvus]
MGHVPRNRGTVLTRIGALTLDGVEALMTVEGGTSSAVFLCFVNDYLVPNLRQDDLVVMDNLGAHHATGVKKAIRAAGADVLYLPPYRPDLNPIELYWSKGSGNWQPAPSAHSRWPSMRPPKPSPSAMRRAGSSIAATRFRVTEHRCQSSEDLLPHALNLPGPRGSSR